MLVPLLGFLVPSVLAGGLGVRAWKARAKRVAAVAAQPGASAPADSANAAPAKKAEVVPFPKPKASPSPGNTGIVSPLLGRAREVLVSVAGEQLPSTATQPAAGDTVKRKLPLPIFTAENLE